MPPDPLHVDKSIFEAILGTGGIGTGTFFGIDGNQTLDREESRHGRHLDRRDYRNLHIVCHYVKTLLGSNIAALPIGRVGDDEAGARLLREMSDAGMRLK